MTPDYTVTADLLRREAAGAEETARYLRAVARIQEETAKYIEKQAGRGETDLCREALNGMVKLLRDPARVLEEGRIWE